MDNRETENLIIDTLNSQKPGKNVLLPAKTVMTKNKPVLQRIKRQFYALSGCSAVLIIAGVLTGFFQIGNNSQSNTLNVIMPSSSAFDYKFLVLAASLIIIGVILAVTAIIIRIKKNKLNK